MLVDTAINQNEARGGGSGAEVTASVSFLSEIAQR